MVLGVGLKKADEVTPIKAEIQDKTQIQPETAEGEVI